MKQFQMYAHEKNEHFNLKNKKKLAPSMTSFIFEIKIIITWVLDIWTKVKFVWN
jgi:hypothetical protein